MDTARSYHSSSFHFHRPQPCGHSRSYYVFYLSLSLYFTFAFILFFIFTFTAHSYIHFCPTHIGCQEPSHWKTRWPQWSGFTAAQQVWRNESKIQKYKWCSMLRLCGSSVWSDTKRLPPCFGAPSRRAQGLDFEDFGEMGHSQVSDWICKCFLSHQ